uniref:C3H1-type domain-containing protein n=1 Tax=Kalanchoe fedtschenkoi TaxID=63787 RepID=A0A7N0TRG9_KALFE
MVPDTNQPAAPEDEASKRNTDCVYFLASPLTCKKGSECEFRHSEYARVNPRDCWYWLNGSCLNPKCAFRHPPLGGLLGTQAAVSAGTALASPQAVAPTPPVAASQSKQAVPCIFFQKGLCLKGDRCAFLHGPNSVATKPPQSAPPSAGVTGSRSVFTITQGSSEPNNSDLNMYTDVKSVPKVSNAQPKANAMAERVVFPSRGFNDEKLSYKSTTVAPLPSGSNILSSNRMYETEKPDDHVTLNDKEADDFYRESSPGFDVLVDDELAEDQYYDEDHYGAAVAGEGKNMKDLDSLPDVDHEMFERSYDGFDRVSAQYSRDKRRISSERTLRGSASLEGRNDNKEGRSDRIGQTDLRHRLKQKKGGGLRSVISNNNHDERRSADSRRDSWLTTPPESSLSGRLQGRIRDIQSPPVRGVFSDRDSERGRNIRRKSPGRTRIHDRIGTRVHDDFGNERNSRGYEGRIEGSEDGVDEFSGPKKLSELKACKSSVKDRLMSGQESFSLGKRKSTGEHEQLDSDLSFEGPKPLSEILKRKKRSEMNAPGTVSSEHKVTNETKSSENSSINKEEPKSAADVSEKRTEPDHTQPFEAPNSDQVDQEEGIIADEGMEDQNFEGHNQGEGGEEYYYEDGEEYNLEDENIDGENIEGEYADEEDGDDFEKKIGGMFS